MMYAVVVCLMSYNVLFPTFYFLDLYTAGNIVMIGLVIALQFKVMFFHHQWSSYQIHSMLFSFYAMFLFYMLIAASVDDYWNYAIKTYNEPITWLWGLFTVPFTAVFIDWFAYFSRYFLFPTQEMIYREMEKSVSISICCRLSSCCRAFVLSCIHTLSPLPFSFVIYPVNILGGV